MASASVLATSALGTGASPTERSLPKAFFAASCWSVTKAASDPSFGFSLLMLAVPVIALVLTASQLVTFTAFGVCRPSYRTDHEISSSRLMVGPAAVGRSVKCSSLPWVHHSNPICRASWSSRA